MPVESISLLEKAIAIAAQAHRGQKRKDGSPYILHPLRMMLRLETEPERTVAVLHDVVEDTPWTIDDLRREGFPEDILQALDCVTRRNGESYEAFVDRAALNPVARRVKLADLEDNMNVRELPEVTPKDTERLAKYLKAWQRLRMM
jgi:(p)ppGpp synthase/HD superfamily hydrolase